MQFDEESHGKIIGKMLSDCKTMREFEINFCDMVHPKCFWDMSSALTNDRCRIQTLRIRNIILTPLEAKTI
jgi:hypothetical protein